MVKSIMFDVAGVYLSGNIKRFVNNSYLLLGIDNFLDASDEVVFDPDLNRGKMSIDECFSKYFGVCISSDRMNELKWFWSSNWVLRNDMFNLVNDLKKNHVLGVISNSDPFNSAEYAKRGWYAPFDHLILSHELGVMKPEKRIYELALEKLGMPAEQCLFIDNQQKCLNPAKDLGMKTILYKSTLQLKEDLIKEGIVSFA